MVAITPNATNHSGLGPKASRPVHVADLPWENTRFPGCEVKTLLLDRASGLVTLLLRMLFQMPNKFFEKDGSVVDMISQDWDLAWKRALPG